MLRSGSHKINIEYLNEKHMAKISLHKDEEFDYTKDFTMYYRNEMVN